MIPTQIPEFVRTDRRLSLDGLRILRALDRDAVFFRATGDIFSDDFTGGADIAWAADMENPAFGLSGASLTVNEGGVYRVMVRFRGSGTGLVTLATLIDDTADTSRAVTGAGASSTITVATDDLFDLTAGQVLRFRATGAVTGLNAGTVLLVQKLK
jgi:hypothetical protein